MSKRRSAAAIGPDHFPGPCRGVVNGPAAPTRVAVNSNFTAVYPSAHLNGNVAEEHKLRLSFDTGDFGPAWPGGIMIAQNGSNPGRARNFKPVRWADVTTALALLQ